MATLIEAFQSSCGVMNQPEHIVTGVRMIDFFEILSSLDSDVVSLPLKGKSFVRWMKDSTLDIPGFPQRYNDSHPHPSLGLVLRTRHLSEIMDFHTTDTKSVVSASYKEGHSGVPIESLDMVALNHMDTHLFNDNLLVRPYLNDLKIAWMSRPPSLYYFSSSLTPRPTLRANVRADWGGISFR